MDIKTIVFDFGNVVGYFDHRRAARHLSAHSELAEDAIFKHLSDDACVDEYESGRITSAEYLSRLRATLRTECTDERLTFGYADIFWPNEEVCTLLPRLKGRYRLLLGSNTTELHAAAFKRQFAETLAHFDGLVLSYEVGARKPKPEFFAHCQRLANCAAAECVFIDDLPANVAGAVACGWRGIVYQKGTDLAGELAALGIHAPDQ